MTKVAMRAKRARRRKAIEALGVITGLAVIITGTVIASNGTNINAGAQQSETSQIEPEALQIATLSMVDFETSVEETVQQDIRHSPREADVEMLAKLIWGEARGVRSTTEKAAVVWCVLNRVDSDGYACGGDIEQVVTFPGQFSGYSNDFPATQEHKDIAEDVLTRWYAEKANATNVGRVLPKEYIYFTGDGIRNYFTDEWKGGNTWDWSIPSPYEN